MKRSIIAIIFLSILFFFNQISIAQNNQKPVKLSITLSNITSRVKNFTDWQCRANLKTAPYEVMSNQKVYKLSKTQSFRLKQFNLKSEEEIINTITGYGYWEGIEAGTNKPFSDKTHFKAVGLKGCKRYYGVFKDDYCQGEFKALVF